jgi:hypothetical protein
LNAIKRAVTEFNRHESFGREGTLEAACLFGGETKLAVGDSPGVLPMTGMLFGTGQPRRVIA